MKKSFFIVLLLIGCASISAQIKRPQKALRKTEVVSPIVTPQETLAEPLLNTEATQQISPDVLLAKMAELEAKFEKLDTQRNDSKKVGINAVGEDLGFQDEKEASKLKALSPASSISAFLLGILLCHSVYFGNQLLTSGLRSTTSNNLWPYCFLAFHYREEIGEYLKKWWQNRQQSKSEDALEEEQEEPYHADNYFE